MATTARATGRRSPNAEPPTHDADGAVAAAVEAWFRQNERELPWRVRRSGYTALVSEAMLQQTQVSRVVDRYIAFMRRFPTVRALAAASVDDVLAAWQGLGYYSRAKRLHAAAQAIVERHGGEVPDDVERLRSLPGVGRYTAGAIASIAFGAREPIVDTNVVRVLMRLSARRGRSAAPEHVEWAWSRAGELVATAKDPARFNEGLMELGATVCPAAAPKCLVCPLAAHCKGSAEALAGRLPEPKPQAKRKRVYHHAVVVRRGEAVLLAKRPAKGLWSSMWQVPTVESDAPLEVPALLERFAERHGARLGGVELLREFVHQTSHREVVFVVHRGSVGARVAVRDAEWVEPAKLDSYALSNPMRAIVLATPGPPSAVRGGRSRSSAPA